ncbi:MAG TPA: hypothetical protein HA330_04580 [Candidatus Thalassarchaeaceae archaeon]|nr:hypothetical protein [Euryarchaeota archaeon]DAC25470.1 MAG TPA: hypothetical protein D7H85_04590 [Candidatus Poseidoniales archaeon]HII49148.1 hypothetical protein [Candidatus Thalassarchaeaceae archaeon]|tara:strand:- start:223 stop:639 length:417 start_codon:yes stop_codon:yes gene_type:complete
MTVRVSRRARRFLRRIQKSREIPDLQVIANEIQNEVDARNISYEEANQLGNQIQNRADMIDVEGLVYAISDRDTYRRTLEIYLKDGLLTRTEQMLLWDERRKLGLTQEEHDRLIDKLIALYRSQGRSIRIQGPSGGDS